MRATLHAGGFSLVEVMCAIVIMGIGLLGLTQGITTALSSSKESELQTTAALLAAAQIETLRADGFVVDGETEGDGEEGLSLYHWKQSISGASIDGLHEVEIRVENARSGKLIYELRTMLFDPPVSVTLDSASDAKNKNKNEDKTKSKEGGRR